MSGVRSIQVDRQIGRQNEEEVLPVLERFFGRKLYKHADDHWPIDFHDEDQTLWCETKKRNIRHDAYATALIGKHKVDFCCDSNCSYYFTWRYLDGIYYIKYDPALFATFECRPYRRFDRMDHSQMETPHYFIPVEHLKRIPSRPMFRS